SMNRKCKILILILIVSVFGCERNHRLKFSGTLELTEHALGAKVAGRMATLTVDEGDEVKKGQLLGTLDRYEQAKKDHDRAQNLMNQGGATQQSLEYSALSVDDQQIVPP